MMTQDEIEQKIKQARFENVLALRTELTRHKVTQTMIHDEAGLSHSGLSCSLNGTYDMTTKALAGILFVLQNHGGDISKFVKAD